MKESAPKGAPEVPGQRFQPQDIPPGPPMVDAALDYVNRDLAVFPCVPGGKRPLVEHGLHDASSDPDVIRAWWSRWPTANIGLRTGVAFHVLDIDEPDGGDTMRALVTEHGRPRRGPTAHTPSGGWHVYFWPPARTVGNRARFVDGCDWRGERGYVVAPPSIGADCYPYVWARTLDVPLPDVPDWLLDLLDPPRPSMPVRRAVTRGSRYAEAALEAEVRAVADASVCRNDRLNQAAFNLGTLVGAGLLEVDAVIDALYHAARSAGLTEREICGGRGDNGTLMSGLRAGFNHPREVTR
jgi:Bifunctional DNA primase/polymerase, N-terminal